MQVNWEQEQSSTFVHIPEHAMEEGRSGASANGTSGSGVPPLPASSSGHRYSNVDRTPMLTAHH